MLMSPLFKRGFDGYIYQYIRGLEFLYFDFPVGGDEKLCCFDLDYFALVGFSIFVEEFYLDIGWGDLFDVVGVCMKYKELLDTARYLCAFTDSCHGGSLGCCDLALD
jgi:hypothetical protein